MKKKAEMEAAVALHIGEIIHLEAKEEITDSVLQELRVQYMALRTLLWVMENKEDAFMMIMRVKTARG